MLSLWGWSEELGARRYPMEEHAKWYPKCQHVLLVKGQMYVDELFRIERPEMDCGVQEEVKEIDEMETLAERIFLKMGLSEGVLKQGNKVAENGHADFKGETLTLLRFKIEKSPDLLGKYINRNTRNGHLHNFEQLPEDDDLDVLNEEKQKLEESHMCKICVENLADIIFLPCGHMSCCPQCAPDMMKCPICRKVIKGQIKASFAIK